MNFKIKIVCPSCSQKLRVPVSMTTLKITCPRCNSMFYYKLQFADFFKKIKKRLSKIFSAPERKFEHSTFGYTSLNSARKIGRIFLIWLIIIFTLLIVTIILKSNNDNKLIETQKNYYQKQIAPPRQNKNDLNI